LHPYEYQIGDTGVQLALITNYQVQSTKRKSLGPLITIYRHRPINRRDLYLIALPGVLAVLIPLFYGYSRAVYATDKFGPAAAWKWSKPWYIFSIAALIVFTSLILHRMQSSRRFIAIHENGLYLSLSDRQMLLWEHIAGISSAFVKYDFLGVNIRSRYLAMLYPNIGSSISLDNTLPNFPELLSRIKAKLYPRLFPSLRKNFQSGQWLYFGPISIHKQGIKINNNQYIWLSINKIDIQSGYLSIDFEEGRSYRVSIKDIPNFELLIELINQRATRE
jgi:hypothetical protein